MIVSRTDGISILKWLTSTFRGQCMESRRLRGPRSATLGIRVRNHCHDLSLDCGDCSRLYTHRNAERGYRFTPVAATRCDEVIATFNFGDDFGGVGCRSLVSASYYTNSTTPIVHKPPIGSSNRGGVHSRQARNSLAERTTAFPHSAAMHASLLEDL